MISSGQDSFICKPSTGRWTKHQHTLFLYGIKTFGKNWKQICKLVKTRTGAQIRSHAQKYFNKCSDEAEKQGHNIELLNTDNSSSIFNPLIEESQTEMSYLFTKIFENQCQFRSSILWELIEFSSEKQPIKLKTAEQLHSVSTDKFRQSFKPYVKEGQHKQEKICC